MVLATSEQRGDAGAPGSLEQAAIVLEDLRLGYQDQETIHDLNLTVAPGQIYGLVGPSGGGKTTILRAILGLSRPWAGRVMVLGQPSTEMPRGLRTRLGYVPQSFALYPNLTIGENLGFVAGLYGLGWRRRKRRKRAVLEAPDLWEHRGKLARQLSGG